MAELRQRDGDEALALCMRAATNLAAARKAAADSTGDILERFLRSRHLATPTGQPLHRYRTQPAEFETIRRSLAAAQATGRLDQARPRDGAAFVLFGAEWFRRNFAGGTARWECLTDEIGPLARNAREELTRAGLDWWRRKVRRLNGANEWLSTLRLEGGFPSRLWIGEGFNADRRRDHILSG